MNKFLSSTKRLTTYANKLGYVSPKIWKKNKRWCISSWSIGNAAVELCYTAKESAAVLKVNAKQMGMLPRKVMPNLTIQYVGWDYSVAPFFDDSGDTVIIYTRPFQSTIHIVLDHYGGDTPIRFPLDPIRCNAN